MKRTPSIVRRVTCGAGNPGSERKQERSWTTLILEHTRRGQSREALTIYTKMLQEGVLPSTRTFVAALKACSIVTDLKAGKRIHAAVIDSGNHTNPFVANTLLHMYAKCGSMVDACQVFEQMIHRTVVSWNAMIIGYAHMEKGESALQLYARMQQEGFTPNDRTFVAALMACGILAAHEKAKQVDGELIKTSCLEKGRAIHSQVANSGLESKIFVATALVAMYVKCGSMMDARKVFQNIQHHDVVSWTAMIIGYAQMENGESALQLYARMEQEGFMPDDRTFVAALKACSSLATNEEAKELDGELIKIKCLEKGRAIHSQLAKSGFESQKFVATALLDMYVKCGSMVDALRVFEKMPHRDVVSWTAMIIGCAQMGKGDLALQLYVRMQREDFKPDDRAIVAALKACASLTAHEEAKEIAGELIKVRCLEIGRTIHSQATNSGFESDVFVATALVTMYVKCGSMVDARQVFEKMPHRDIVSWTAMIIGYAQMEKGDLALQLYTRMQHDGFMPDDHTFVAALKACGSLAMHEEAKLIDGELVKIRCLEKGRAIHSQVEKSGFESDIFVATTLVAMYVKCGSMFEARQIFEKMMHRTVVTWTVMIIGYAQMGRGDLALKLYVRMQHEGFSPDVCTFVAALKACGSLASLEAGKRIHASICKVGLEGEAFIATCLIDMYGKCGSMVDAQRLFDASPVRDVATWNALIAGYSGQGDSVCVFNLFERMQQESIWPDGITFVSLFTVCSHSGLVDKGQKYFQDMCSYYGIVPHSEHYSCMADLLGRAGQLDDAVAMVEIMPFQPVIVTWMTILSACQKWNNVEIGRHAFECAVRLDGRCAAAYVLMMNIFISAHMWEESAKTWEMRMNAQAWIRPAQSWWSNCTGFVHTFLVGDRNHPESKDIDAKVKDLIVKMEEEVYVPEFCNVLLDTSENDKEDVLCGNSGKLAIACTLINTPRRTAVWIVKNLHVLMIVTMPLLLSQKYSITLICRDASRFHVYMIGKCSCGDFW